MALKLYFHPLSSFCQKVLVALYEKGTAFEPVMVDFFNEAENAKFKALWPIGRIPVLRDEDNDRTIPESSVIIEYLERLEAKSVRLVPEDPDLALQMRMRDRFYDLYVNVPMQKVVTDRLRPQGRNDPHGVEEAKIVLRTALDITEKEMADRRWAVGDTFSMADCAAAPALFYADKVMPLAESHKHVAAYLGRLKGRASFARALEEAQPYFALVPK